MKLFLTITILGDICLGLFLLVLHLGINGAVEGGEPYSQPLPLTMQLGVFPPDMICFTKAPAEVNTSLTYSASSLRSIFLIF